MRARPRLLRALLCAAALAPLLAAAEPVPGAGGHRGWGYLVDKLVADGVARERVVRVFADGRVEPFTGLEFGMGGQEPRSLYRGFLRASSIAGARRCRETNAAVLQDAQRQYGVPASVVAAILYVETGCGRNTGSSVVFTRLARLAMANEPENLRLNFLRLAGCEEPDPATATRIRARARYLEDTFYPEVRAAFEVARRMGVDPLDLRGSSSGAVGFPQFLPTSYLRYGTDADGDGRVDLFDSADAAASCANYLAAKGWRPGLSDAGRRSVIWHYNHSPAYVDAVLTLSRRIDGPALVQHVAARPRKRATGSGHRPREMRSAGRPARRRA
jgi:membrane-bound lytic murein transglycosylase B